MNNVTNHELLQAMQILSKALPTFPNGKRQEQINERLQDVMDEFVIRMRTTKQPPAKVL